MRRAGRLAPLALLVALGWVLTPRAVPLYDGVGFPDQPYRYLTSPTGQAGRPAPTGAHGTASVSFGINAAGLHLASDELGPQVVVDLPAGSLIVPKPAHQVTVTVLPVPGDVVPTEGPFDGNVYRLTFAGDGPSARLSMDGSAYLYLRAAVLTDPVPHIDYRPSSGAPWQQLKSDRIGSDVLSVAVAGPGDYVVVQVRSARVSGSGSSTRLLLLGLGVAVLLGLGVVGLRRTAAE